MVASPERIDAFFDLAASGFSDEGWTVASVQRDAVLSHRLCPPCCRLGGLLLKFDFRNVFIQKMPEDPSELLVRPEVRGEFHDRCSTQVKIELQETLMPGDALVLETSYLWILRLGFILFGNAAGPFINTFFYNETAVAAHHVLRRDWPSPGDASYANFQDHGAQQEYLVISRLEKDSPSHARVIVLFHMPEEKWAHWAAPSLLFPTMTSMGRACIDRWMNRPHVQEMRALDRRHYIILGLRNFHHGAPLVPMRRTEAPRLATVVLSGPLDWRCWSHYEPEEGKFQLASFLRCFSRAMPAESTETDEPGTDATSPLSTCVQRLDGRRLVPYQCAVLRREWEAKKERLLQAFGAQKGAYRRLHGGSSAPNLLEMAPRFVRGARGPKAAPKAAAPKAAAHVAREASSSGKLVVRKTFLEVEEEAAQTLPFGALRRCKSDPIRRGDVRS